MKVCNKCGKQYDDNGIFCSSCGGMLTTVGNPNMTNAANRNYVNAQSNNVRNNYQPNMNNSTGSNNQPNTNSNVRANNQPNMINNAGVNNQQNTNDNYVQVDYQHNMDKNQTNSTFPLKHVLNLVSDLMAILSNLFVMVSLGYARVVESPYSYLNANGEIMEVFSPDEDFAIAALIFAIMAVIGSIINLVLIILKRISFKEMCPFITRVVISVALLIASIALLDS